MDIINDGAINQAIGGGIFRFTGSANNIISGANTPQFDMVEIAKPGIAKVSLLRNISIGSGITFTTGLIDLNNNNILLSSTALLTGERENSRITGTNGGYIELTKNLNAPSAANPGNLGAIISTAANMGATVIRRGHQSQTNGSGNGNSIFRYYDIIPDNNTTLNATLQFTYFDAELNGLTENVLFLWKSSNNTLWLPQGFTSRDVVVNYVEKTSISDFSRWTLSSPGNALPVLFTQFAIKCNNNKVQANWKTAQEQNSSYFELQRSQDGLNWITVGSIPAAGNSSTERSYSFTDNNPATGIAFYRVVEFDINGHMQYTPVLNNECGQTGIFKVWPNPVQEQLFVNISTVRSTAASIKIFDSKGALIIEKQPALLPGNNNLIIDMKNLAAGTYMLLAQWNNGEKHETIKIIKQ